jgi:hypothetical protein
MSQKGVLVQIVLASDTWVRPMVHGKELGLAVFGG